MPSWTAPLKSSLRGTPRASDALWKAFTKLVGGSQVGYGHRAAGAVEGVPAPFLVLAGFEVGQNIVPAPAGAPGGLPAIEVLGWTHVDHAVDRAGSTQHLARGWNSLRLFRWGSGSLS